MQRGARFIALSLLYQMLDKQSRRFPRCINYRIDHVAANGTVDADTSQNGFQVLTTKSRYSTKTEAAESGRSSSEQQPTVADEGVCITSMLGKEED